MMQLFNSHYFYYTVPVYQLYSTTQIDYTIPHTCFLNPNVRILQIDNSRYVVEPMNLENFPYSHKFIIHYIL